MTRAATVGPKTLGAVVFLVSVCMTPISLVEPIVKATGEGTLLWMLLAGGFSLLGGCLNLLLIEAPLVAWADRLRDWMRYPRVLFYATGSATMLNIWLNILSGSELPSTPRLVLALLTLAVTAYALRMGVETVTRLVGLIGVIVAPIVFGLALLALTNAQLGPLLPHPLGTGQIPWIWPTILFAPRGYDILPAFGPLARPLQWRPVYVGLALASAVLLLSIVTPILVFGYAATLRFAFPYLSAVSTYTSQFLPFQRIGFLSFIAWQMIAFAITTAYAMAALVSLHAQVHPLTPWTAVTAIVLVVLALSLYLMPADISILEKNIWSTYGILLFCLSPGILLAAGRRRRQAVPA